MHTRLPKGLFAQGYEPPAADVAAATLLLSRVQNIREVSGIDSLKHSQRLPSGGVATVIDVAGVKKVILSGTAPPPPIVPDVEDYEFARLEVPLLYSGTIDSATVVEGAGVPITVTSQTLRRLKGYAPEYEAPDMKRLVLKRFEIPYAMWHQELLPKPFPPVGKTVTQYAQLYPTWFTGAMREVVQIVGGYGKRERESREKSFIRVPEPIRKQIEREVGAFTRLPGYLGVPPQSGEIQYDYKFLNTDAVAFDVAKKPWLIKVSSGAGFPAGVWAMPLPMIPATTTTPFRRWMEDVGDTEILKILDRFGGMPSGEGFPRDFHAWRRAGVIIKVADVSEYFRHTPYTTPSGFCFNSIGTDAFGTCFDAGNPHVGTHSVGYAFALRMNLGDAEDAGWLKKGFERKNQNEMTRINDYLSSIFRALSRIDDPTTVAAVKYKIRRHTAEQILSLIGSDLNYWVNLEMGPIATHSASFRLVNKGYLVGVNYAFKLPEVFGEQHGCISPLVFTAPKSKEDGGNPKCDTIMYGFYDNDDALKVIRYFYEDPREGTPADPEPPRPHWNGDYEWKGASTGTNILGSYYTTDFDHRELTQNDYKRFKVKGAYLHTSQWVVFQIWHFWRFFDVRREHYFQVERWEDDIESKVLKCATLVPFGFRSGYVYGKVDYEIIREKKYSKQWEYGGDKYQYHYWTFEWSDAWATYDMPQDKLDLMRYTVPFPSNWYPVYPWPPYKTINEVSAPEQDQGEYEPSTDEVYAAIRGPSFLDGGHRYGTGGIQVPIKPPNWKPILTIERPENPETEENHFFRFVHKAAPIVLEHQVPPNYFMKSPLPPANIVYMVFGTQNACGDAKFTYLSEGDHRYGYSKYLTNPKAIPRFIGVINE